MFYIGLDLGQASDYTAITVLERLEGSGPGQYHLRHIERPKLGTPYPAIVTRLCDMANSPEIAQQYMVIADATGVGAPVVDLLRQAQLAVTAVTITGGDKPNHEGGNWRVPKRDLVFSLLTVLQTGRLKVADGLPLGPTLINELLNFKVKIDPQTAHDSYASWREGVHDDLVLSAAMAVWWAERFGGSALDLFAFIALD